MSGYVGLLYVILSSIYTISFARQSWKKGNKLAAFGAALLVAISIGLSIWVFSRT
ncbi:MAG: hypothetical protein GXX10_08870 [Clostridiaceae bacterium]|nr:hypothetical protein [Clostridiaceae bacterium]